MRVLVTGAGALLGQGMMRALKQSSLDPFIISVDPSPLSAGLYWSDAAALVPMARDPSYLDELESVIDEHRPDAVLVGTDVELEKLALHRERIEAAYDTHVVVASPEVIRIADDKYLTAKFFLARGLDAPVSGIRGEEEAVIEQVGFPLVVKPRIGARSVGVSVVHTRADLATAMQSLENPVVQECVGDDTVEYTAGSLTFDGECRATIVMRRDLRDGNTYRAFVEDFPELNAHVRTWANALNAYGPANFQFRIDGQGQAKVFEINGRFSGTTPLRRYAGFPEVEMVLRHVVRGEPIVQPEVKSVTILRHWSETVIPTSDVIC